MGRRKIEMHEFRNVLIRLRAGDRDREVARLGLMGRVKVAQFRALALSFAYLIGVKPKTLQNWEQRRVRPAGPARALLKIVAANPEALAAIHAH